MDIKNIDQFAKLCVDRKDDAEFIAGLNIAERIADIVDQEERHFPSHGEFKPNIDQAFETVRGSVALTNARLETIDAVLSTYWKHHTTFSEWFKSKVIVVRK